MSLNTCLITRCFSSASAIIRSWFIYELQKSTTIAFSRNSLYSFYSRNPTCETPHAFGFPIVNTPHSFRIPVQRTPLPLGNPRSRPWYRYGYFLELPNLTSHLKLLFSFWTLFFFSVHIMFPSVCCFVPQLSSSWFSPNHRKKHMCSFSMILKLDYSFTFIYNNTKRQHPNGLC